MRMIRRQSRHSAVTKMYKGYLIDLDGTMFNGSEVIDGAVDFIERLNEQEIPYLFLTNNATRHPEEIQKKMQAMGFTTSAARFYTSALAMKSYLHETFESPSVYVIGTDSFKANLFEDGRIIFNDQAPDAVVMGLDPSITFDKITTACQLIQEGAHFLATNPDIRIKTSFGFSPGNGSFVKLVSEVTGQQPVITGKPHSYILKGALQKLGISADETVMIGDNYDTDILTGINGGVDTIHVNTGVHTTAYVMNEEKKPVHTVESLADWQP